MIIIKHSERRIHGEDFGTGIVAVDAMSEKSKNAAVQQGVPGAKHMPIGEFGGAPSPPGGGFMLSSPMYWFYEATHAALNPARAYADAAVLVPVISSASGEERARLENQLGQLRRLLDQHRRQQAA